MAIAIAPKINVVSKKRLIITSSAARCNGQVTTSREKSCAGDL